MIAKAKDYVSCCFQFLEIKASFFPSFSILMLLRLIALNMKLFVSISLSLATS